VLKKILIANRGEIAVRVIRTCREMGIATVAVYSELDREALHVRMADEAYALGGETAAESYLNTEAILDAIEKSGADGVHPGYGFFSENTDFARAITDRGVTFIGPPPEAIEVMGDKISSRIAAEAAGVAGVPGRSEPLTSPDEVVAFGEEVGWPLAIKAAYGGGGRGMKVVESAADAAEAMESAAREAQAYFGRPEIYVERYLGWPRHVEMQVLGDTHGTMLWLGERDCSAQRRHQKLVEESPAPAFPDEVRQAMGEAAVKVSKACGYYNAGTVEFLYQEGEFYFLEMNTRLQVEHPVTECITGLDLVEQMLRVAAGEPLAFTQETLTRSGWAIECRINAEDPLRNFLPSTGRLVTYRPPPETMQASLPVPADGGVRVDTGVYEGGEIPMYYDSMIAKLIVKGADRAQAIERMREALNGFVIRGISSNVAFQSALLAHPRFMAGTFNTGFIAEEYPKGFTGAEPRRGAPGFLPALAATAEFRLERLAASIDGQLHGHSPREGEEFTVVTAEGSGGGRTFIPLSIVPEGDALRVTVNGQPHHITLDGTLRDIVVRGEFDGAPYTAQIEHRGLEWRITHDGVIRSFRVVSPRAAELLALMPVKAAPDLSRFLLSPMPGLLVDVAVAPGQSVRAGERLAVIEAMKMENILVAAEDRVVEEVLAKKGDSLAVDQIILRFK
jgi:propionyl-CoA carboxylase alpha chain